MIQLDNSKWKEFEGGYRIPYDASIPLKKLEEATTQQEIDSVFSELWNELHHQGDVGLASYFSIPHIIRIAKEKKLHDYNALGLVTTIEIERHANNPKLPEEFEEAYLFSIQKELPDLAMQMINEKWDTTLTATTLAALAVSKGHIEIANAILKMEDKDILEEFLEITDQITIIIRGLDTPLRVSKHRSLPCPPLVGEALQHKYNYNLGWS